MPTPKVTVTLQVTEETHKKWTAWQKHYGMSLSTFIRECVRRQCEELERLQLPQR